MVKRPAVEEETVEKLDKKLQHIMKVPPESVGLDKKINVLLDEYTEVKRQKNNLERNADNSGGLR